MATEETTLSDAFYKTLKDVHYPEKQSVRTLGKPAKAAKLQEQKEASTTHREESSNQVEPLEQVFEILGKPARTKTSEATKSIVAEMEADLDEKSDDAKARKELAEANDDVKAIARTSSTSRS